MAWAPEHTIQRELLVSHDFARICGSFSIFQTCWILYGIVHKLSHLTKLQQLVISCIKVFVTTSLSSEIVKFAKRVLRRVEYTGRLENKCQAWRSKLLMLPSQKPDVKKKVLLHPTAMDMLEDWLCSMARRMRRHPHEQDYLTSSSSFLLSTESRLCPPCTSTLIQTATWSSYRLIRMPQTCIWQEL